jgi:hypothetical protein
MRMLSGARRAWDLALDFDTKISGWCTGHRTAGAILCWAAGI